MTGIEGGLKSGEKKGRGRTSDRERRLIKISTKKNLECWPKSKCIWKDSQGNMAMKEAKMQKDSKANQLNRINTAINGGKYEGKDVPSKKKGRKEGGALRKGGVGGGGEALFLKKSNFYDNSMRGSEEKGKDVQLDVLKVLKKGTMEGENGAKQKNSN